MDVPAAAVNAEVGEAKAQSLQSAGSKVQIGGEVEGGLR